MLPAELAPEAPPIKSAEPVDAPPDEPTDVFTIKLVMPATMEPIMLPIKPKKSEPPAAALGFVAVAAVSASASAEPSLRMVCWEPAKKFCRNSFGWSGRSSSSGSWVWKKKSCV